MQKKILSAVLSLLLVGSASSAFAGYYDVNVNKSLTINDSFKDQSDDDVFDLDIDVKKSVAISDSYNKTKNISVNKETSLKLNAQGNFVKGKFVVQQFGGSGNGAGGEVINVDNSINHSAINSYNHTDSYNTNKTITKTKNISYNINDSYNKTRTSTRSLDLNVHVDIDKSRTFKAYKSFNHNQLGGFGRVVR